MTGVHSRRSFLTAALHGAAVWALAPRSGLGSNLHRVSKGAFVDRACHTMGSTLRITALGESRTHAIEGISSAFAEVNRLDRALSVYQAESCVSRINNAAGRSAVVVEGEVLNAIARGIHYSRRLEGAFDITLEPLMRAWGFRADSGNEGPAPSDQELLRLIEAVGFHQIECDVFSASVGLRNSSSALDLGGIGVGFAIDRAVAVLRERGIQNAFVNHSGDAYALGCPPESDGWEVGIPDPRNPHKLHLSFTIADRAVSTSGSYENFREHGGHTYGHILDPRTGRPVESHLSATTIAACSLDADVLSTAAFCGSASGATEACADEAQVEVILLDGSIAGGLVLSHHAPAGSHRTPLHIQEG